MTRRQDRTAISDPSHTYAMGERLAQEAKQKSDVQLLFSPHEIEDISALKSERKLGVDFLLHPRVPGYVGEPIRCENKFEQMATGRVDYELVSVDRPTLVPGWMYTSTAAWVCSWFPSGEMLAVHMSELRTLVLPRPGMFKSTTTGNTRYLTWNALPDVNLVLDRCPSGRVLDLQFELGGDYDKKRMFHARHRNRIVRSEELVEHMLTMPTKTDPVGISREGLIEVMKVLRPNNFRARQHEALIERLAFLNS